jgi:hypothetical protein
MRPEEETLVSRTVMNLLSVFRIVAIVTGLLAAVSFALAWFPPDRILDWGDGINAIHANLELADKTFAYATGALAVVYLGAYILKLRFPSTLFVAIWDGLMRVRRILNPVALSFVAVCSFGLTASRAGGPSAASGPIEALTKARAESIQDYRALVWNIRLELTKELSIKAVSSVYDQLPAPAKAAVATESVVNDRAQRIPAPYLNPDFTGMKAAELESFQPPAAVFPKPPPTAPAAIVQPPAGISARILREATAESRRLPAATQPPLVRPAAGGPPEDPDLPNWMQGPGRDVLNEAAGLALSPDRLPGLQSLSLTHPLLGELLAAPLEALFETASAKFQSVSSEIARQRLANPHASLKILIGFAVGELSREVKVEPLSPRLVNDSEDAVSSYQKRVDSADQRWKKDLERAIVEKSKLLEAYQGMLRGWDGKQHPLETLDAKYFAAATEAIVLENQQQVLSDLNSADPLDRLQALSSAVAAYRSVIFDTSRESAEMRARIQQLTGNVAEDMEQARKGQDPVKGSGIGNSVYDEILRERLRESRDHELIDRR